MFKYYNTKLEDRRYMYIVQDILKLKRLDLYSIKYRFESRYSFRYTYVSTESTYLHENFHH